MRDITIGSKVFINSDTLKRPWRVMFVTKHNNPTKCTLYSTDPDNEKCRRTVEVSKLSTI